MLTCGPIPARVARRTQSDNAARWASQSNIDNVEYLIIDNPPPGILRLKAINWRAPSFGLPVAIAAKIIRGDPTPAISMTATPSTTSPAVGSSFTIKTTIVNPSLRGIWSSGVSGRGVQRSKPARGLDHPRGWSGDGFSECGQPHTWHCNGGRYALGHLEIQCHLARPADRPLQRPVEQRRHCLQERDRYTLSTPGGPYPSLTKVTLDILVQSTRSAESPNRECIAVENARGFETIGTQ